MRRSKTVYWSLPFIGLQILDIANGSLNIFDDIKIENKNGAISMVGVAEIGAST